MAHSVAARAAGPVPDRSRLVSLDGLRGLAALVVVVHHGLLSWRPLAAQYFGADRSSGTWWLTFTPLHLAWAGTEAVMVFFVLSGLVLALPFLQRESGVRRWRSYYGQRLVRLYVPVLASLALAAVLVATFPRQAGPTTSWWFDAHAVGVDVATVTRDAVLLHGVSWIHPSLWSLRYEVLFSLLLPAYLVLPRRLGERAGLLVPPLLALAGAGVYLGSATVSWLPVFGLGVVLATLRRRVRWTGELIAGCAAPRTAWALLTTTALTLLLAEWWCRGGGETGSVALALARVCAVTGATMVCALVMARPQAWLFTCRPVRWLGTVSFSLYLVHEPLVVSISSLVGGSVRGVAVTVVAGTVLSLLLAAVFHRLVEAPSQRLARAVGARVGRTAPDTGAQPRPPLAPVPARPVVSTARTAMAAPSRPRRTRPVPLAATGAHPLPTRPIPVPRAVPAPNGDGLAVGARQRSAVAD